jgi:hypothetical protein
LKYRYKRSKPPPKIGDGLASPKIAARRVLQVGRGWEPPVLVAGNFNIINILENASIF